MEGRKETGYGHITNETIMHGLECKARMNYIITGKAQFLTLANVICLSRRVVSMFKRVI
jgi:hypothetical protein